MEGLPVGVLLGGELGLSLGVGHTLPKALGDAASEAGDDRGHCNESAPLFDAVDIEEESEPVFVGESLCSPVGSMEVGEVPRFFLIPLIQSRN